MIRNMPCFRRGITQRNVDFSLFKRRRVTVIVDADDELLCLCPCHLFKADA